MNAQKDTKKTYSIIDMVVLSILLRQPMNAYALAQYVEQNQVTRLVKISTPAIYKSCKRLYEQKHLNGKLTRDGEAPEKKFYTVTDSGNARFTELMQHFSNSITPFYFEINSVVYGLEGLDYEDGLELIDTYMSQIKTMQSYLIPHSQEAQAKATFASRMIVKQYLMTVEVLVKWIEELREEFVQKHTE